MCENISILFKFTNSLDNQRPKDARSNEHTLTTASSKHRRCRWPPGGTRVPLARGLLLPARILAQTSTHAHLKFDAGHHRANAMILAGCRRGLEESKVISLNPAQYLPAPGRHLGKLDHLTVPGGRFSPRPLVPPIWNSNCESSCSLAPPSQSCLRRSRGHAGDFHEQPTE